jgi:hypothetical protein
MSAGASRSRRDDASFPRAPDEPGGRKSCGDAVSARWYTPPLTDHARLDARSLAYHTLIAEKVRADPALLDHARDNLRRWKGRFKEQGAYMLVFDEWQAILNGPIEGLLRVLTDPSERATRLRQSSPFPGVLTDEERHGIFEQYRPTPLARCGRFSGQVTSKKGASIRARFGKLNTGDYSLSGNG